MDFHVHILGSNSAIADHGRHPTSQVVSISNHYMLVDCGEGTQERLKEFKVKWFRIDHIFISHLHGDHYYGLIGLLTTYNLLKRTQPLTIYSPLLLKDIIALQLKASQTQLNYELKFIDTKDDGQHLLLENEQLEVHSFPLYHKIPTTGFLFKQKEGERRLLVEKVEGLPIERTDYALLKKGIDITDKEGNRINAEAVTVAGSSPKTYAFCSDTTYNKSLVSHITDADLLYHEATFLENDRERAEETKHSTALQAAQIAKQSNVKKLLIGHFSSRYPDLSDLLKEAQSVFTNTALAEEGEVFEV